MSWNNHGRMGSNAGKRYQAIRFPKRPVLHNILIFLSFLIGRQLSKFQILQTNKRFIKRNTGNQLDIARFQIKTTHEIHFLKILFNNSMLMTTVPNHARMNWCTNSPNYVQLPNGKTSGVYNLWFIYLFFVSLAIFKSFTIACKDFISFIKIVQSYIREAEKV